jgi:hypothetical protein
VIDANEIHHNTPSCLVGNSLLYVHSDIPTFGVLHGPSGLTSAGNLYMIMIA